MFNSSYLHIVALDGGSISRPWASTFCSNHEEITARPSRGTARVSLYNILVSLLPWRQTWYNSNSFFLGEKINYVLGKTLSPYYVSCPGSQHLLNLRNLFTNIHVFLEQRTFLSSREIKRNLILQWGHVATVPLGLGNTATDAVIAHIERAVPCCQHSRQIFSHDLHWKMVLVLIPSYRLVNRVEFYI